MSRFTRNVRLIPIVIIATVSLFALKVSGLVFDGGYTLAERLQGRDKTDMQVVPASSVPDHPNIVNADDQQPGEVARRRSWAQEMFNYGETGGRDITGSVGESKPPEPALKTSDKPPDPPKLEVGNMSVPLEQGKIRSAGENAVLERLRDRSQALEARGREMDMRESLIKAAEKRLEAKVAELKDVEARVNTAVDNRDKAEAERFKSIVSMYENMKPKDAARIFDRLELKILVEVSTQMNPRKMSEILAAMSAESAERLTVELANRASAAAKPQGDGHLPKIEGKPNGT